MTHRYASVPWKGASAIPGVDRQSNGSVLRARSEQRKEPDVLLVERLLRPRVPAQRPAVGSVRRHGYKVVAMDPPLELLLRGIVALVIMGVVILGARIRFRADRERGAPTDIGLD